MALDADAVTAGRAEALVSGYDTTYSIDCKDDAGNRVTGSPTYVEKGNMVALAHETLEAVQMYLLREPYLFPTLR